MTPVAKPDAPQTETYVVCLDCGKRFAYNLKEMHIGRAMKSAPATKLLPNEMHQQGMRLAIFASALSALVAVFGVRRGAARR